jgi:hypothetical protein
MPFATVGAQITPGALGGSPTMTVLSGASSPAPARSRGALVIALVAMLVVGLGITAFVVIGGTRRDDTASTRPPAPAASPTTAEPPAAPSPVEQPATVAAPVDAMAAVETPPADATLPVETAVPVDAAKPTGTKRTGHKPRPHRPKPPSTPSDDNDNAPM